MPVAMAMPLTKPRTVPRAEERRRHQRVKVNLLGRYMLADRREFPVPGGQHVAGRHGVVAPVFGNPGERVIAYVDHLGRLEGKIARMLDNGFAMTIAATSRKRDKLAAQLTWLANRQILNLPEDRRHGRFTPRNSLARLILPNGTNVTCRVIDLSASGAGDRDRSRTAAGGRRRGYHRQDHGPGGPSYRGRLRHRIHPPAASRLHRRKRHRRIASPAGKRAA